MFILWLTDRSAKNYFIEFTQRLNAPVAMYMADNASLLKNGELDADALQELLKHAMTVNPSLEIYLLDSSGTVYAPLPKSADQSNPVTLDTGPIKSFINGDARFPLYGDYPGQQNDKRTFSVHPLTHEGRLKGYVYVVLGGEKHSSLLERVTSSYVLKNLLITVAVVLVLALVAGIAVFSLLTRRLRQLRSQVAAVQAFQAKTDISAQASGNNTHDYQDDELGELSRAYDELNARLADQYDALQRSDRGRRELFANISHDLRTPLTALSGYLETLKIKLGNSDDNLQSYADIAYRQTQKLRELVSQLLELSIINSGELVLRLEVFSLIELVHDITQDFQIELNKKHIELTISPDAQSRELFSVTADISLIQRVLENLLNNAIEHTPTYGKITIELSDHRGQIRTCVADTGPGISKQLINDIFSRYHSGHGQNLPSAKRLSSQQHAGLGLAIVKGILDLHGCDIQVESQIRSGTRFFFSLPIAACEPPVTGAVKVTRTVPALM